MAFYQSLFLLALLSSPLLAIKCYTGESRDGSYSGYNLQATDCNGNYCSREIESSNIAGSAPKYSYMCGNDAGSSNIAQICSGTGDRTYNPTSFTSVDKYCCKGDYCNSTASTGSLFTVIASIAALFFNKMM